MSSVSGVCQNRQLLVNVAVSGDGKQYRRLVAAIDTGAMITAIRADLVESMNLPWRATLKIGTASDTVDANLYRAIIGLPVGDAVTQKRGVQIAALPLVGDFDLLLGMDILEQCCFVCCGGAFFLGFDGADDATKKAAAVFLGG